MKIIQFLLLLYSLCCFPLNSAELADDREKRRAATEKELSQLQLKIKQLQSQQAKNRTTLSREQQALKKTDLQIGQSRKNLDITRKKLRDSQSRLKALTAQRQRLNLDKQDQQRALKEQIRAAYAGGKQEYIKLLFNQEDPGKVGRTLVYYDYLNKARLDKIQQFNITLEKLQQVEAKITTEQQQLTQHEAGLKQETERLAALKSRRQQAISELNNSLQSDSRILKEWRANEVDLMSLLEALKQTVETLLPEESLDGLLKLKGKLNWPVKGRIHESFGSKRGNDQMRWTGILIGAEEGQKVTAIHHGRIVYSDYLRGFGLIAIIDHGNGYMSLYGHNEALYKQPGDWVEAGEQIATVGQSGGYPKTGLYFEIRHRSKALNPLRFIRRG